MTGLLSPAQKWRDPKYERHREELERRGITVAEACERGYEPLTAEETFRAVRQDAGESIAIACLRADGSTHPHRRFRLLDPTHDESGKLRKYTQRAGTGVIIHVRRPGAARRAKSGKRRIITEGEIKADEAAALLGVEALSVPGVNCFLKGGELHPDIAALKWDGFTAELCYDTDQNGKPQVRRALIDIADRLAALGATVRFREIYSVPNLRKTGIDDFLRHYGARAYESAPLHDLESDQVRGWREELAKAGSAPTARRTRRRTPRGSPRGTGPPPAAPRGRARVRTCWTAPRARRGPRTTRARSPRAPAQRCPGSPRRRSGRAPRPPRPTSGCAPPPSRYSPRASSRGSPNSRASETPTRRPCARWRSSGTSCGTGARPTRSAGSRPASAPRSTRASASSRSRRPPSPTWWAVRTTSTRPRAA